MKYSEQQIFELLSEIEDPEIPVLNIVEMGIVRSVTKQEHEIFIDITPTYSGCPAMKLIEDKIKERLVEAGIENIKINTVYAPAWTTDWLTEEARTKLRYSGIAPPAGSSKQETLFETEYPAVICPYCNSSNTMLTSEFGSTACKALYFCNSCNQPFEYMKSI